MMSSMRVLIVDDSFQVRHDLRTVLDLAGRVCSTPLEIAGEAANGLEAVRQVEALQPDIVLMDLAMPVMDGWEAARRIKTRFPSIRVIALTVHCDADSRQKACLSGMDGFIEKGVPAIDILQAMIGKEA